MSTTSIRLSAGERREEIIAAAVTRFGATGLHGTSTETIARDVGVSQPYVFRLFGTKKELFMEAVAGASATRCGRCARLLPTPATRTTRSEGWARRTSRSS